VNAKDLIDFEHEIADLFNAGRIRAPVHLYDGNENQMLDIFTTVKPEDWVCCSWRSHYQCLLKGVPREELKQAILDGKSITLCFPEYRVISSAIVGGILPIALGLAKASRGEHVHCFMGDMTAETGIAHECMKYARNYDLPIRWIVEDNGRSTCTPTRPTWKQINPAFVGAVTYYKYTPKFPHAGAGVRVQF